MFPRALRIARIGGIDVRVDPSWLLIALLVVWSLLTRFQAEPGRPVAIGLTMAVVGALLFFASVLAHELAHALEARRRGLKVQGITLFLFGGVTEMHLETQRPRDEFVVAAVGPYVSLVSAAALGLIATGVNRLPGGVLSPVAVVAGLIAWINLGLALFNLIPGAPLDGGRVLRAVVWGVTHDRVRALRIASRAGQVVGLLVVGLGIVSILNDPGALITGLWFGFIGWFMWNAAGSELRQGELHDLLAGRTVGSLVTGAPPRLPADQPLSFVADRIAASQGSDVFLVVARDDTDAAVGILHVDDVMGMHPHDRGFRTPADVMRPIDAVPAIAADAPLTELLSRMAEDAVLKVVAPVDDAASPGDGHPPDADDQYPGQVQALLTERQVNGALARLHALERRQRRGPRHVPHPLGAGAPGAERQGRRWLPSDDTDRRGRRRP